MDWDPDLQTFWMTCASTGLVYEVALDEVASVFRVVQVFPSQGQGGPMAITAIRGSTRPHHLVEADELAHEMMVERVEDFFLNIEEIAENE